MTRLIARELTAQCWTEPDEVLMPVAQNRARDGHDTTYLYYRGIRKMQLQQAHRCAESGVLAITDSCMELFADRLMECGGYDFFLPHGDPYRPAVREIARIDHEKIPHPDILIHISIERELWTEFWKQRDQMEMDHEPEAERLWLLQEPMREICEQYTLMPNKEVIFVEQNQNKTIDELATEITNKLRELL